MSYTCLTPIFAHGRKLPCGKCGNCVRKRSLEWLFRLKCESRNWDTTSFITLTYNEDKLPPNGVDKEEISKFLKRLRRLCNFKYYLVSEYGPTTLRPHYHVLFFHNLSQEAFYSKVESLWHSIVTIGEVTEGRVMYCANYHITKSFHPDGKNENFVHMSKGLGKSYLTSERLDYFRISGNFHVNHYDGYRLPLPRYYKSKIVFTEEQIDKMKEIIDRQSLIDSKSAYKLRRLQEKIDKYIEKKMKKKNHI